MPRPIKLNIVDIWAPCIYLFHCAVYGNATYHGTCFRMLKCFDIRSAILEFYTYKERKFHKSKNLKYKKLPNEIYLSLIYFIFIYNKSDKT
ncbi:hypothetical protein RJT34_17425 [Clitoria ternatea]|uniref:Uncharacterized protein n=1 Tax=Clitoria ternatea TaxID=43366 RepID=A0AAN9JAA2_CLITE